MNMNKYVKNCNAPNILNPYSPSSNHPQNSFIVSIHHDTIPYKDHIHKPFTTEDPNNNLALSLWDVGMFETETYPVIASIKNKSLWLSLIDVVCKRMTRDPEFHPPTICQRFAQYNAKHGTSPKMAPVNWKPNPPISQHCHQHVLRRTIPEINFTEPSSTDQQLHLYDLLSSLYSNYYSIQEPPHVPTPSSLCVTHDNNGSINTVLPPESITSHITVFYNVYVNHIPVYQYLLRKCIIPLFPDYDQEFSQNVIRIMGLNWWGSW